MAVLNEFNYSALTSNGMQDLDLADRAGHIIRLLTLHPGNDSDLVNCELNIHVLESDPDYEAISYVWGDEKDRREIKVSGQPMSITANLHSALVSFRFKDKSRILWCDAVCINQASVEDRTEQVAIMGQIYSHARRVLIYLGDNMERDKGAIQLIQTLQETLPEDVGEDLSITESHETIQLEQKVRLLNSVSLDDRRIFGTLLQRPWFSRAWVVQEALLAQTAKLYVGSEGVDWSLFISVLRRIALLNLGPALFGPANVQVFSSVIASFANKMIVKHDLFNVLCYTRNHESKDPKDKLFAFLGVADSSTVPWEIVDYHQSVETIFIKFTKLDLAAGRLHHLSAVNYAHDDQVLDLPSWVPDWTRIVDAIPGPATDYEFEASGNTTPEIRIMDTSNELIIVGKKFSCVSSRATICYNDISSVALVPDVNNARIIATLEAVHEWLSQCHQSAFGIDFCMTQETESSEAYLRLCRTIYRYDSARNTSLNEAIVRLSQLYRPLEASLTALRKGDITSFVNHRELVSAVLYDLDVYHAYHSLKKYFFSDGRGMLGWVSRLAEVGDVVCIFDGADTPHLLRPQPDGRYKLVGDCYFLGCEDGKAFDSFDNVLAQFTII